ncbi:MAG TPA: hypothetical protein VFW87_05230 [Pirellulales bacterium]|nr:hypothetical protein [Pirellulales bacterium]
MGEYFKIVNPAKKEYIDALNFGEGIKRRGILLGKHGLAVGCLVCRGAGKGELFGSWAGDDVFIAGDEHPPNEWGITTATPERPDRNLNQMARDEYEDISYKAIVMLCEFDSSMIEEFAKKASTDSCLLLSLGYAAYQLGYKPIEKALVEIIGKNWTKQLAAAQNIRRGLSGLPAAHRTVENP